MNIISKKLMFLKLDFTKFKMSCDICFDDKNIITFQENG